MTGSTDKIKKGALFVPFYTPSSSDRLAELMYALQKNVDHPWIEKICLMIDDDSFEHTSPPHKKILIHRLNRRPTYADWIELSCRHAPDVDLSICANADIELANDFLESALRETRHTKTILCITRYDLDDANEAHLRNHPHWTQDTWAITPDAVDIVYKSFSDQLNIPFGTPRCDTRVPYIFWLRGWDIINPCNRVVTIHHQRSSARAYSKKDITILGGSAYAHPSQSESAPSDIDIDIFSLNEADPQKLRHNKFLTKAEPSLSEGQPVEFAVNKNRLNPSSLSLTEKQLVLLTTRELESWKLVHEFNRRFRIYEKSDKIAFIDADWPSGIIYKNPGILYYTPKQLLEAFFWGFCLPTTEFLPGQFSSYKSFTDQRNFWQYPCRTEQDAFERHQKITGPVLSANTVHTYIGLPWATWIDKKDIPKSLLKAFGDRIESVKTFLAELGLDLHVHSVCQHIYWKRDMDYFQRAGVNHLWISHKEKGWDTEQALRLHAWPLYAVNVLDPARQKGLKSMSAEKKSTFASFKGAHMKHYLSDIRLQLKELGKVDGYEIEVTDLWHYNHLVYKYQVANNEAGKESIDWDEVAAYNTLLSQSLFSLCPGGAGPNTLRLWESLGIGSIPVVLSDRFEFPDISTAKKTHIKWSDAVVMMPENNISQLDDLLRSFSLNTCQAMQDAGLTLFKECQSLTCF
jgi:hypothetical protein